MISRKPGLKYVHRAEPDNYDYDQTTLIQDAVWHTLSLAAIIPASAKLVLLRVGAAHASTGRSFCISKVGESNFYSCVNVVTQVADLANEQTALVDCSGQQIQYRTTLGTFSSLRIVVLGWFV